MSRGRQLPVRRRLPGSRPGIVGAGGLPVDGFAGVAAVDRTPGRAENGIVEKARLGPGAVAASATAPVLSGKNQNFFNTFRANLKNLHLR